MRHPRRQISPLQRRSAQRDPKRRFTIFCEGKCTEPAYFDALRRHFADALIAIRIEPAAGVPYTLAEKAAAHAREAASDARRRGRRDSYEKQDETWAVFDRDEHPRHAEAVLLCERHRVGIARSNPCFEVWLILHEQEYDKPDGRHAVQRLLRDLRPEYDPNRAKSPDCASLIGRLAEAERRGEAQLERRKRDGAPFAAPSTTVWQLTRAIAQAAAGASPPR